MVFLREQLANHELQVVEYYIKRGAFLSAANRASYLVKHFPKTSAIPRALSSMVIAYRKLGMKQLEKDALAILEHNYPDSDALKVLPQR